MRLPLPFAAVLSVCVLSSLPVAAQFEDEFDDEFDEAATPADAAESDDPFEEDPLEEDVATESEATDGDSSTSGSRHEADENEEHADPRDDPADARRFRMFNTFVGPTGGVHVLDAHGAPAGTFRVQLGIEFFAKNGFLFPSDNHSRVGGTVSLSWAVHDLVEVYGSLISYANSNSQEFPDLLIVLGDAVLGSKVGAFVSPVLSLGGDVRLLLPTGSGLGVAFDGLGLALRGTLTADLRGLDDPKPFLVRANLGYTFDRSERLIRSVENERYGLLPDPLPPRDETRHLISRVERYSLGINRTDFLHLGVGFEAPLDVRDDIHISPLLEWNLDVPVNRQGYDCAFVPAEPGGSRAAPGDDDCLSRKGFASFPMSLTFGVRVQPVVRGLGFWLGLDVGLTGQRRSAAVRELAQNEPWRLLIGVSYAHDTRGPRIPPPVIREREVPVEVPQEPPPRGRVHGQVVAKGESTPIPHAVIGFPDRDATALRADAAGRFVTYAFDPGPVRMNVGAEGMHPTPCEATIDDEGNDIEVVCELERQLVAVEEEQVVILEQIQFAFDSAEILAESFGLMTQIAQALRENPQIGLVEIQGHTDDQGAYEYNEDLSQRRADSVKQWLVEHGIEESRLRARGYGESRPLVNDTTDEARARNRRVEFRIMERTE